MKKLLAVAALALVMTSVAQAQTASISATATVQTALTLNAGTALDFGAVFPGAPARVINPQSSSTAGTFSMSGAAGAQVALTFTLPGTLAGQGAAAGNTLTPTWGAQAAAFNTTNAQGTASLFDPSTVHNVNLAAAGGAGYIWVGGSVTAPVAQVAGSYLGTIQLAAAYTGN